MKRGEILVDVLGIEAGVFIALPGVDRKAGRRQSQRFYGLAHGRIGDAVMRPQFNDRPRAQHVDEPEDERHMFGPRRLRLTLGRPQHRRAKDGRRRVTRSFPVWPAVGFAPCECLRVQVSPPTALAGSSLVGVPAFRRQTLVWALPSQPATMGALRCARLQLAHLNVVHRDSDQSRADAARMRFQYEGVMYPMMLQMFHLRAFGYGDADAVVADRKDRHAELEQGFEPLARFHLQRGIEVGEASVVSKQRLPKPILHKEADNRRRDVHMGLATHSQPDLLAADAPGEAPAL